VSCTVAPHLTSIHSTPNTLHVIVLVGGGEGLKLIWFAICFPRSNLYGGAVDASPSVFTFSTYTLTRHPSLLFILPLPRQLSHQRQFITINSGASASISPLKWLLLQLRKLRSTSTHRRISRLTQNQTSR
jgi:hypothetical protein